jgi:hypothetical protein
MLLSVACAAAVAVACVAVGIRARARLRALAPPSLELLLSRASEAAQAAAAPELVLAEIDVDRRSALTGMELSLLALRASARVALAAGTACALVALASELGRDAQRATLMAACCFALGGLATAWVAQLGQMARADFKRFRDDWNRRLREAKSRLAAAG